MSDNWLGSALGGLFEVSQAEVQRRELALAQQQAGTFGGQGLGLTSQDYNNWTTGTITMDGTDAVTITPGKSYVGALPETALAWLDRRVEELRVKL